MPLQNGSPPHGMQWHYRLRVHGLSNALFSAHTASALHEGAPIGPAADIRVDYATNMVSLVLKASALGGPATLSGAKVYVNAWDYDGGYRELSSQASSGKFGSAGAVDVLVMDETSVIVVP